MNYQADLKSRMLWTTDNDQAEMNKPKKLNVIWYKQQLSSRPKKLNVSGEYTGHVTECEQGESMTGQGWVDGGQGDGVPPVPVPRAVPPS